MGENSKDYQTGFRQSVGASPVAVAVGILVAVIPKSAIPPIDRALSNGAELTIKSILIVGYFLFLWFHYSRMRLFFNQHLESIDRKIRTLVARMENEKTKSSDARSATTMQHTQENLEDVSSDLKRLYNPRKS